MYKQNVLHFNSPDRQGLPAASPSFAINPALLKYVLLPLALAALFFLYSTSAHAMGILMPKDKSLPALAIKSHRVQVNINDQSAHTTVDQVFVNSTGRDLEAVYIFPLPKGAAATDFALWMNGKRIKGEVLEANKAKSIYREIVTRMKDPGLLEYMGNNMFKASIYPVPAKGEQRVQLSYAQVVQYDAGICNYVYPLRTDRVAARTIDDFTVSVDIKSAVPIKTVYSPSHETSMTRNSEKHVTAGFEANAAFLDRDFELFYTLSEKDVGITMLTHREGGDGYFMLMVAPSSSPDEDSILAKDVIFVVDTSGSMAGDKIARAKQALTYCLNSLRPEDRYNIVRFSDGIHPMSKVLIEANKTNVDKGIKFAEKFRAVGGTNINKALLTALEVDQSADRPRIIVFLTDGLPTVGTTGLKNIVENIGQANKGGWRIFSFGVGNDINTHLLDKISGGNGGATTYVRPDAEIETKISSFFNKVEKPVLTKVSLDFGKAEVVDTFPQEMPDLFAGNQLVVLGRYENTTDTAIILEGWRGEAKVGNAQDVKFPKEQPDNPFIKQLWANRKVGYLLDEIRLNGENRELVAEVTRLGTEFGIVTPYTSYLVTEPKSASQTRFAGGRIPDMDDEFAADITGSADGNLGGFDDLKNRARRSYGPAKKAEAKASPAPALMSESSLKAQTGSGAVSAGKEIKTLKEKDKAFDNSGATRHAAGKTFVFKSGFYVDTNHKKGNQTITIKYGSDAYFILLEIYPKAKSFLALGEYVIVSLAKGKSIIISKEGKETLTKNELKPYLP